MFNERGCAMSKLLDLNTDDIEPLYLFGKALSSPIRIEIIKLLYTHSFNIAEIAEKMKIPASSAAMHVRALEAAGLINTEVQPGERGSMKLCSRKSDYVTICLTGAPSMVNETTSISMPIGAFTDCQIAPTCGIATADTLLGHEDKQSSFYLPSRIDAQILWSSSGYLEYRFPNESPQKPKQVSLSLEICSEAPNYREDWKSDLTVWINGVECATWTCPGDFGGRRGRLNPSWWENGNTQYGLLTTWTISDAGTTINGQPGSGRTLGELGLDGNTYILVRIGNKPDAQCVGGFNIFGERFGDHAQNIVLTLEY